MKFYLAATIYRWREHNIVRDILVAAGHELTYDWTLHGDNGSLRGAPPKVWQEAAVREAQAVAEAEFFVGLLPGGLGTNAEVGMSAIRGIQTYLHATDLDLFDPSVDGKTTTFYWHPAARRFYGMNLDTFAHQVVEDLKGLGDPAGFYLGYPIPLILRHLDALESCEDCPVGGQDGSGPVCPRASLCDWECGVQVSVMQDGD